jgi:hypothetical protein
VLLRQYFISCHFASFFFIFGVFLCGWRARQVAIASAGGIAAVLAAMGAHVSVVGVQEQGCAALRNLAGNDANKVRDRERGRKWKYHYVSKIMTKHVFYDNNFNKIVFFLYQKSN